MTKRKKGIFLSIRPDALKRICTKEKNYEFRKYYPKQEIEILYVYETFPTCALKYRIELGNIIHYLNKIEKEGYGNFEFNQGLKEAKYAYEIKHVDLLEKPFPLSQLKEVYGFVPPQSYAYDTKYQELVKAICKRKKKRLF